jgi:hypothetical protein
MTQTPKLQTSSASWTADDNEDDMTPPPSSPPFDSEKYKSTGFFVRSTLAGGVAGCTVIPLDIQARSDVVGKDSHRTSGSDKDSIPNGESGVQTL